MYRNKSYIFLLCTTFIILQLLLSKGIISGNYDLYHYTNSQNYKFNFYTILYFFNLALLSYPWIEDSIFVRIKSNFNSFLLMNYGPIILTNMVSTFVASIIVIIIQGGSFTIVELIVSVFVAFIYQLFLVFLFICIYISIRRKKFSFVLSYIIFYMLNYIVFVYMGVFENLIIMGITLMLYYYIIKRLDI